MYNTVLEDYRRRIQKNITRLENLVKYAQTVSELEELDNLVEWDSMEELLEPKENS